MMKIIGPLLLAGVVALSSGCITYAKEIRYSLLVDRVENDAVIVIVHLSLKGGMSWYGTGAQQKATNAATQVLRLELAKKRIVDYTINEVGYLEIRQNIHRVGFSISDRNGALTKLVGQTMHGTTSEP